MLLPDNLWKSERKHGLQMETSSGKKSKQEVRNQFNQPHRESRKLDRSIQQVPSQDVLSARVNISTVGK